MSKAEDNRMKNIPITIIRALRGFYGTGLVTLGLVNLWDCLLIFREYPIKEILSQSMFLKCLLISKLIFYSYMFAVGIAVFMRKKWIFTGTILLPFLFMTIDHFSKTDRTLASYIMWVVFLFSLVLVCNLLKNAEDQ